MKRAISAAKVKKIFSKPFVTSFSGHADAIACFAKSQTNLAHFLSGSWDGEVRFWNLTDRQTIFAVNAHEKFVKSLCFSQNGQFFLTVGNDYVINLFNTDKSIEKASEKIVPKPEKKFTSKVPLSSVDHKPGSNVFVTAGQVVQIWSYERSTPIQTCEWGIDSTSKVRFNPSEPDLVVVTSLDRGVFLYDTRTSSCLQKTVLMNKSSAVCWNPQEPVNFTVGNEDSNCYSMDMRKLSSIRMIHKDHIGGSWLSTFPLLFYWFLL